MTDRYFQAVFLTATGIPMSVRVPRSLFEGLQRVPIADAAILTAQDGAVNVKATTLWWACVPEVRDKDFIRGDVLVIGMDPDGETDLPDTYRQRLMKGD